LPVSIAAADSSIPAAPALPVPAATQPEPTAPAPPTGFVQEIDLTNYNNQQYMGNIYIGDSKQEIPMLFDTGSPMIYILTDECDSSSCPQKKKFEVFASSSYKVN